MTARLTPPARMDCPYCGGAMIRRDSRFGLFYGCRSYPKCQATVGCHADGRPLGTPANAETKAARIAAHAAFDPLWKDGPLNRHAAYAWLASALGLSADETHIGMFDADTCRRVVLACAARRQEAP